MENEGIYSLYDPYTKHMLIFPLRASNFKLDQEAAGMDCECCECTLYDLGMVYVLGVVGSLELLLTVSTTITIFCYCFYYHYYYYGRW